MNSEGNELIDEVNEGVDEVKNSIVNGDINGLITLFQTVGARGLRELIVSTTNACVKHTLLEFQNIDENVVCQLRNIRDPVAAGRLVCNTFSFKAQLLNKCNTKC